MNTERPGCILALNNHVSTALSSSVQTGWPHTLLTEVITNTTVLTDGNGIVTLSVPPRGYRIYVKEE